MDGLKKSLSNGEIADLFADSFPKMYESAARIARHDVNPYISKALKGMTDNELIRIANDVDIDMNSFIKKSVKPAPKSVVQEYADFLRQTPKKAPEPFRPVSEFAIPKLAPTRSGLTTLPPLKYDSSPVKAFISHSSNSKEYANSIRIALKEYNIEAFFSDKDIPDSTEWQDEIMKNLRTMNFFISIHSSGFSKSVWCQQEVGAAAIRAVKTIAIKFDEKPDGFIGKYNAINGKKPLKEVIDRILNVLKISEETKDLYSAKVADKVTKKVVKTVDEVIQGATGRFSDRFSDRFDTGHSQKARQLGDPLPGKKRQLDDPL